MQKLHTCAELVIISPHLDDAIFSLGGWLKQISGSTRIQVINVFTRTGFVFEEFRGVEEGTGIRKNEDAIALSAAGIQSIHNLDFPEALERGYDRAHIFLEADAEQSPEEGLSHHIKDRIEMILPQDAWILGPAGFGAHVDHIVTRNALKTLPDAKYYAELPYVARTKKRSLAEEFLKSKTRESVAPTNDVIDFHIQLCRLYASQIQERHLTEMKGHLNVSGYQFWQ
jgi:LmbE family N-acetylglucosaminyl deacetylase